MSYRLTAEQSAWIALGVALVAAGMAWSWPRLRGRDERLLAPFILLAMPTLLMVIVFWLSLMRVVPDLGETVATSTLWTALGVAACVAAWFAPRSMPPSRVRRLAVWTTLGGVLIFIAGVVWMLTPIYTHRRSLLDGIVEFLRRRL